MTHASRELPDAMRGYTRGRASIRLAPGLHSREERARAIKTGACQRLGRRERAASPLAFRDLILSIAGVMAGRAIIDE